MSGQRLGLQSIGSEAAVSKVRPTIGMGILSWRGAKSLDYALKSYAYEALFSYFDACAIILPEPDTAVKQAASQHPLDIYELTQNIGIAGGMKTIAQKLTTDYVLFLENDCPLIESADEARRQIDMALNVLDTDVAIMARLRSRRLPGEHFTTLEKYRRYWQNGTLPKLRRMLRPAKAKRLSGTAIYASQAPAEKHPQSIQIYTGDPSGTSYLVNSNVMPWTNQSILIKREIFLEVILPYVESCPLRRPVNGFHNIEIALNQSDFWVKSGYKIFCPKGLFTHKRLEYRGYA